MGFLHTIISQYKEKSTARNEACDNLIKHIDMSLQEINEIFSNEHSFIEPCKVADWYKCNSSIISAIDTEDIQKLKKAVRFNNLLKKQADLHQRVNGLKLQTSNHNNRVADAKISNAYALIGEIEGRLLDRQQIFLMEFYDED